MKLWGSVFFAGLVSLMLMIPVYAPSARASSSYHLMGTASWTLAWVYFDDPVPGVFCIHYVNNLNYTLEGNVYFVVRNTMGQTEQITQAITSLQPRNGSNVYIAMDSNLHGQYTISVFATSSDIEAISNTTSFGYYGGIKS